MLDTDILSDLVRHPQGRIAARIGEVGEEAVCASIVVAAELRFGAMKRGSPRLTAQVEAVLGALQVLPFEEPADRAYAELRARLETAGAPIGGNDMLIAAHAIAADCTLVTGNDREFTRVAGLSVANWLR
jgi:tRNA(fMet)-specific endonuclease VapC